MVTTPSRGGVTRMVYPVELRGVSAEATPLATVKSPSVTPVTGLEKVARTVKFALVGLEVVVVRVTVGTVVSTPIRVCAAAVLLFPAAS